MTFEPVVLKIKVGKVEKKVGKIVRVPYNGIVPNLANVPVLWKEVKWKDFISHKLQMGGCDAMAWEYANAHGAKGLIVWASDVRKLIVIRAEKMNNYPIINLGEYGQIRIPVRDFEEYPNVKESIVKEWVIKELLLEPKKGWPDSAEQKSLFD